MAGKGWLSLLETTGQAWTDPKEGLNYPVTCISRYTRAYLRHCFQQIPLLHHSSDSTTSRKKVPGSSEPSSVFQAWSSRVIFRYRFRVSRDRVTRKGSWSLKNDNLKTKRDVRRGKRRSFQGCQQPCVWTFGGKSREW